MACAVFQGRRIVVFNIVVVAVVIVIVIVIVIIIIIIILMSECSFDKNVWYLSNHRHQSTNQSMDQSIDQSSIRKSSLRLLIPPSKQTQRALPGHKNIHHHRYQVEGERE